MVWDVIEGLAVVAIVAGGFLLVGPAALIVGGVLALILSWLVHRQSDRKEGAE